MGQHPVSKKSSLRWYHFGWQEVQSRVARIRRLFVISPLHLAHPCPEIDAHNWEEIFSVLFCCLDNDRTPTFGQSHLAAFFPPAPSGRVLEIARQRTEDVAGLPRRIVKDQPLTVQPVPAHVPRLPRETLRQNYQPDFKKAGSCQVDLGKEITRLVWP